jgi:hypothetical protein
LADEILEGRRPPGTIEGHGRNLRTAPRASRSSPRFEGSRERERTLLPATFPV